MKTYTYKITIELTKLEAESTAADHVTAFWWRGADASKRRNARKRGCVKFQQAIRAALKRKS